MMLGLRPTSRRSGKVNVLGFDPAREPLQAKRRVGYLPDSVGFYDHLTAIENLSSDLLISRNFKDFAPRPIRRLNAVECPGIVSRWR